MRYILLILSFLYLSNNAYSMTDITEALNEYNHSSLVGNIKNNQAISQQEENIKFEQRAEKLAKELQEVLAAKLLNTMYEGIKPDPIFGGGNSEKMFQSMLNDERAKIIDLGLVQAIKSQIINIKKNNRGIQNDK